MKYSSVRDPLLFDGAAGRHPAAGCLTAIMLLTMTGIAQAQETADGQNKEAEPQLSSIEEMYVTGREMQVASSTGTKTDTPIIETPQAVSVVPSFRFELQGATTVEDALLYSSGVRADSYGMDARGDWAFIRGVDFVQYLNGLKMLVGNYNTPRPDPFVLSSVEILRGPSSVLYGQGTTGGIVNLVSKAPLREFAGEVSAEYGSFDRKQLNLDLGGPLDAEGKFLYRLIAVGRDSDSPVDHIPDDRMLVAPSLTWAPSDKTDLTLRFVYQEDNTGSTANFLPHSGVLLDNPNGRIPFDRFVSEPGFEQYDTELASIGWTFRHRFSDMFQFRQVGRYAHSEVNYQSMYPDSYSNPLDPFIDENDRVVNRYVYVSRPEVDMLGIDNQAQADFTTGAIEHKFLVGVDYHDFKETTVSGFGLGAPLDLFDPVYSGQEVPPLSDPSTSKQDQVGLYIQDQITIADRLLVSAALRRDWTEADGDDANATTKRLGVMYQVPGGLAPYASYAESFEPVAGTDFNGDAYKPTKGKQWEAGLKYQPTGAPYIFTAALFHIKEQNRLIDDPNNPMNQIQAGEARSRGLELEGSGQILPNTDMIVSYSHTDVELTESDNPAAIGRQLESVPKHLVSAWVSHSVPLGNDMGLRGGAGIRWVGKSYGYIATEPVTTITTPSVTLADAMVGFDYRQWGLQLNVSNVFDKKYISTCLGRGDCFVGEPRRIVAKATRRF